MTIRLGAHGAAHCLATRSLERYWRDEDDRADHHRHVRVSGLRLSPTSAQLKGS